MRGPPGRRHGSVWETSCACRPFVGNRGARSRSPCSVAGAAGGRRGSSSRSPSRMLGMMRRGSARVQTPPVARTTRPPGIAMAPPATGTRRAVERRTAELLTKGTAAARVTQRMQGHRNCSPRGRGSTGTALTRRIGAHAARRALLRRLAALGGAAKMRAAAAAAQRRRGDGPGDVGPGELWGCVALPQAACHLALTALAAPRTEAALAHVVGACTSSGSSFLQLGASFVQAVGLTVDLDSKLEGFRRNFDSHIV